ncbi:MAG: hypothetical protein ACRDUA_01500 [Micromonosporaceae bacterium]
MRRTNSDAIAESASEAQHEAVRADTPAARTTSLSPRTVSVAEVPPTSLTGTVLSRISGGARRLLSARSQLPIVAALVAVTSFATALVVAQGARQLDISPRQATTPYLAARPSGPVRVPATSSTAPDRDAKDRDAKDTRSTSDAAPQPGGRGGWSEPDRSTDRDRRTPERGQVPEAAPSPRPDTPSSPPEVTPTPPEERCRIGLRLLGRCVLGSPHSSEDRELLPGLS